MAAVRYASLPTTSAPRAITNQPVMEATSNRRNLPKLSIRTASSKATDYLAKTWRKFWKSPPAAKAIVILFLCSGLLVLTIIAVFGPKLIGQKLYDWSQELRKFQYGWLILTAIIGASHSPHSGLGERC